MPRPLLLALSALALLGACRPAADADVVDSPGGSVAGTETKPDSSSTRTTHAGQTPKSGLASTLIAVASVDASDAQPCERVCGSLGDCLHLDDDHSAAIAGGLELECLDMCVYSPEGNRAKTDFLACGSKTECSQLVGCAERSWSALADARQGPEVAGVVSVADPCKSGCRWYFSCAFSGLPPGEAHIEPYLETQMEDCMEACELNTGIDRSLWIEMSRCLPDHCAIDRVSECFSRW